MQSLEAIADLLEAAPRYGISPDRQPGSRPGAEAVANEAGDVGVTDRYIRLSDRMARDIAMSLRRHAKGESPRAVAVERR
jgi:hypothetical protein